MLAASLVVGTATTVGYSLATGFDRAAERADLPDIIARFSREPMDEIDPRVSALPNLEARSYRHEALDHPLRFGSKTTRKGAIITMLGGRRGYAIVEGRDLRDGTTGEVVVERGLAREWGVHVGDDAHADPLSGPASRRHRDLARQRRLPAGQRGARLHHGRAGARTRPPPDAERRACCGSTTPRRPT